MTGVASRRHIVEQMRMVALVPAQLMAKRSHADCPHEAAAQTLKCIGGRWKVLILQRLLAEGASGFNELQRALEGVSAKMLAQQLRELEADGVVLRREIVPEPPKTVQYDLTPIGKQLAPVVAALEEWGQSWLSEELPTAQR